METPLQRQRSQRCHFLALPLRINAQPPVKGSSATTLLPSLLFPGHTLTHFGATVLLSQASLSPNAVTPSLRGPSHCMSLEPGVLKVMPGWERAQKHFTAPGDKAGKLSTGRQCEGRGMRVAWDTHRGDCLLFFRNCPERDKHRGSSLGPKVTFPCPTPQYQHKTTFVATVQTQAA